MVLGQPTEGCFEGVGIEISWLRCGLNGVNEAHCLEAVELPIKSGRLLFESFGQHCHAAATLCDEALVAGSLKLTQSQFF